MSMCHTSGAKADRTARPRFYVICYFTFRSLDTSQQNLFASEKVLRTQLVSEILENRPWAQNTVRTD